MRSLRWRVLSVILILRLIIVIVLRVLDPLLMIILLRMKIFVAIRKKACLVTHALLVTANAPIVHLHAIRNTAAVVIQIRMKTLGIIIVDTNYLVLFECAALDIVAN